MKKSNYLLVTVLFASVFMFFIAYGQEVKEWVVPEENKAVKNPVEASKENITVGKMIYKKHCKSCHGDEGLGDGPKSETLETYCGDFSSEEFQAQTDGELFYKTTEGRDEMPSFKQKIPDSDDRWCVINYMRTFK